MPISRKQAVRLLAPVEVGFGALLLSAVDHWSITAATLPPPVRTMSEPLMRGTHVSGLLAGSIRAWLLSGGKHPPAINSVTEATSGWPEVDVRGQVRLQFHRLPAQPTGPRKKAFVAQLPIDMGLPEQTLCCELNWEFDRYTGSRLIWAGFNVPSSGWSPIEIPLKAARRQYLRWSGRRVPWLPFAADVMSDQTVVVLSSAIPSTRITPRRDANRLIGKGETTEKTGS